MVPRVVFNIGDWGDFVSLVQVICTPIAKHSMEGIFMAKITKKAKVPSKSTKAEMVDKDQIEMVCGKLRYHALSGKVGGAGRDGYPA